MGTVPTGKLERELRKLYLNWVMGLPRHDGDILEYIDKFRRDSEALIARMGGQVARLGVYLADFPAPRELTLSPVAGVIYDQMKQASSSTGVCDASYIHGTSVSGARQWLSLGTLWFGGDAGLGYVFGRNSLSNADWATGSRLSAIGRSQ